MSAPPKSVVKYAGLSVHATAAGCNAGGRGVDPGVFGTPLRFALASGPSAHSPSGILRLLRIKPARDAGKHLCTLIDQRAQELPLPDGCAVIPIAEGHRVVW